MICEERVKKRQSKMAKKTSEVTGSETKTGEASKMKQSEKEETTLRRQQDAQGRGGRGGRGLAMAPRASRRSERLNKQTNMEELEGKEGTEHIGVNPYDALRMDEEEELDDEMMEENDRKQEGVQTSPRRPAVKRTGEALSLSSMRRPTTKGKHERSEANMEIEERYEEHRSKEDDRSFRSEQGIENDDFRYETKGVNPNDDSLGEMIGVDCDSEVIRKIGDDGKIPEGTEMERASVEKEKAEEEKSASGSEEVEWDDSALDQEMNLERREEGGRKEKRKSEQPRKQVKNVFVPISEERMIEEVGGENKKANIDEILETPRKNNKTVDQEKARKRQEAREQLLHARQERVARSEKGEQEEEDSVNSASTIQQGNLNQDQNQASPRRDLRCAREGVALPVFKGTLPRKFLYRYDVKLSVPANENAVATLIQTARTFWMQVLEADKAAALVPWAEEHQSENPLILNLLRFPTTPGLLKRYFSRAQPSTSSQTLYVSILLAHDLPFDEIMENIRWWLIERKCGMWRRQVQAETVKQIGYLLYSTRALEPEYMKPLVEKYVNRDKRSSRHGHKIELGFRWRVIPMGKQGRIREEDQVRALHVECSAEQFQVAKAILSDIYSANTAKFPGYIKLRLVPDIYGVANPETRAKILHLRARQALFLSKVMTMTSYEIASLDHRFGDEDGFLGSIRERLMWIKSKERESLSQFVSVTTQYNGSGVVFTFIPQLESEARSMVASVIPLFRYAYGAKVSKYFKAEAWDMHAETQWDPKLRVAVTQDDQRVDDIKDQDLEYQWEEVGGSAKFTNVPRRPDPNEKSLYGDDGGDSVSTFNTKTMQERLEEASQRVSTPVNTRPSATVTPVSTQTGGVRISSTSSITSTLDGTVESRISTLESVAEQTNRMMQDMIKMMEKFSNQQTNVEVATSADQYQGNSARGERAE